MKKFFLLTAFIIAGFAQLFAEDYTDSNGVRWTFSCDDENNTAVIEGISDIGSELTVPGVITVKDKQYTVTGLNVSFRDNKTLEKVVLPSTINSINDRQFFSCSNLIEINLSNVTAIGYAAFTSCSKLKSVDLSSCTNLEGESFHDCYSLESVGDLSKLEVVNAWTFGSCVSLKSVTLSSNCKEIGEAAFFSCYNMKTVGDLSACTKINENAFNACRSLTSVNLSSCEYIGGSAFYACGSLTSIGDLSKCKSIESVAFNGCNQILEITFASATEPSTLGDNLALAQYPVIRVPDGLVEAYKSADVWSDLKHRIIGFGATTDYTITTDKANNKDIFSLIGEDNLANVVSLKVTGDIGGFDVIMLRDKMVNLHKLDLSDAKIVGDETVYYENYCTKDNVVTNSMFYKLGKLTEVKLPSGITKIAESAFQNCSNLRNIEIPNNVTTIEDNAFRGCGALASVSFPSNLKSIVGAAFAYCTSLKSVSLPTRLETIGGSAFSDSGLETIEVPSSVLNIGDYAFANTPLRNVYMYILSPEKVTVGQSTFSDDTKKLGTLYYPVSDKDERNRFYYKDSKWSAFLNLQDFSGEYKYAPIGGDYYLGEDTRLNGEGIEAELGSQAGLTVEGNTKDQNFGDVHIEHDGNTAGSLIADGNVNAENLYFDMKIKAGKWYFFCFPFKVLLSDITCPGQHVWRKYDGAKRAKGEGGWTDLEANEDHLKKGFGYIFQASKSGTLTLKVTKDNFGKFEKQDHQQAVETHEADDDNNASWNFMGNPHTSYYGIGEMGYDAPITIWTGDTYEAVRPGDDDYYLQPFQAFFIQKPEGTESVTFEADNKKTYGQSQAAASEAKQRRLARGVNKDRLLINLTITDGENTDKTRVVFNDKQSVGYETTCDAAKFMSSESVPQLYTLDNKLVRYAINERPNGDVYVGYSVKKAGDYSINATRMDKPVLLKDLLMNITFDLASGDYTFHSEAGDFNKRFMLVAASDVTGIADIQSKTGVSIMTTEGGISISGAAGRQVAVHGVNGAQIATHLSDGIVSVQAGAYIVSVDGMATKVLVR